MFLLLCLLYLMLVIVLCNMAGNDFLRVWFYGKVFGVSGSNGTTSSRIKSKMVTGRHPEKKLNGRVIISWARRSDRITPLLHELHCMFSFSDWRKKLHRWSRTVTALHPC